QALDRARAAYAAGSWLEAYEAFAAADEGDALAPDDLELRATTARMLVRDDEAVEILERAHHAYLERGETPRAAYCAGWIGTTLFYKGAARSRRRADRTRAPAPRRRAGRDGSARLCPAAGRLPPRGGGRSGGGRSGCCRGGGDREAARRRRVDGAGDSRPGPHARAGRSSPRR